MAKAKVSEFISYIHSKVGNAYLWGGQGESLFSLTQKLAKQNGQSDENTEAMISYMESQGIKDIQFFDCSGLGVSYLLEHGAISYDMTADELYRKCTKIKKGDARTGDMVFLLNASERATHVGYIVKDGVVVHALNQSAGVIEEPISNRKWVYGRPDFCLVYDLGIDISKLKKGDKITTTKDYKGYNCEYDAKRVGDTKLVYPAGNYYIYKVCNGAVNITRNKGVPGAWVIL